MGSAAETHPAPEMQTRGPDVANKLPAVTPHARCRLRLLKMQRIHDFLLMEEEFIKNQERLKPQDEHKQVCEVVPPQSAHQHDATTQTFTNPMPPPAQEERTRVDDLRGTPMTVGSLEEIIDDNHAIVSTATGPEYYVAMLSIVDKDQLEPGCTVLLHHKTSAVIGVLEDDTDPMVSVMKLEKAPKETYADIGGLDKQIQEIKEAVELPLTHPEYYEEMGIKPPKGVILYGVPGTGWGWEGGREGAWPRLRSVLAHSLSQILSSPLPPPPGKTLLAKAVANQTSATFLRVVGSELIQKYAGEGPKLVRELFRVAEEHAPSIVFIDEIDAVGTKRWVF